MNAWESRADTKSWYAKQIRDAMISETTLRLKRNIGLIKALIAICPLLGLLGTVTGMITVFDVMTFSRITSYNVCYTKLLRGVMLISASSTCACFLAMQGPPPAERRRKRRQQFTSGAGADLPAFPIQCWPCVPARCRNNFV